MKVIPVIDIQNNIVVSAQQGMRLQYQPIRSKISLSSEIEDVIHGFLSVFAFKSIYIADLNAITGQGNNQHLIDSVILQYPHIDFWVDNGIKIQNLTQTSSPKYRPIIGTECQNLENFNISSEHLVNTTLSLDFFPDQGYTGPLCLLNQPELWPLDVIIMNLEYVGKNAGPDFKKLIDFRDKYPEHRFVAAGGIRNIDDLLALQKIGIDQVLIASALHSGEINGEMIENLQAKKYPGKTEVSSNNM